MALHQCSQVIQSPRLSHNRKTRLSLQKQDQSLAKNGMIVSEDYFHGMAK